MQLAYIFLLFWIWVSKELNKQLATCQMFFCNRDNFLEIDPKMSVKNFEFLESFRKFVVY